MSMCQDWGATHDPGTLLVCLSALHHPWTHSFFHSFSKYVLVPYCLCLEPQWGAKWVRSMPSGTRRQEKKMRYLVIGDIMGKCRGLRCLQRESPIKTRFHTQCKVVLWAEKPASRYTQFSGGQWWPGQGTGSCGSGVPSSSWACLAIP